MSDPVQPPPPPEPIDGCAGIGTPLGDGDITDFADYGSRGVKYQCQGTAKPSLTYMAVCNYPGICYDSDENWNGLCGDLDVGGGHADDNIKECPPVTDLDSVKEEDATKTMTFFTLKFGPSFEDYMDAAVTACCRLSPEPGNEAVAASCNASCSKLTCDNVHSYLQFLRSSPENMASVCCTAVPEPKEGEEPLPCAGDFQCQGAECGPQGPLIDVCAEALDTWLAATAPDAWGQYCLENVVDGVSACQEFAADPALSCSGRCGQTREEIGGCSCAPNCRETQDCCDDVCTYCAEATDACFLGECASNQARGEVQRLPDVTVEDLLWVRDPDPDDGLDVGALPESVRRFTVQLRNVFIESNCAFSSQNPAADLPPNPETCGEVTYDGPPNGWPEGAGWGDGLVPLNPDEGGTSQVRVFVHDPGAASSVEEDLNLPSEVTSYVESGTMVYGTPFCEDVGCMFTINRMDANVAGVVQEFNKLGQRRIVVSDASLHLNGRAVGRITAVDPDGTVHFLLPEGSVSVFAAAKAVHQKRVAGSWDTVDSWDGALPVANRVPATGRVDAQGRLEIDELRFSSGDFTMSIHLTSGPPLDRGPQIEVVKAPDPCGGLLLSAEGTADDHDGLDALSFTWFRGSAIIGTDPTLFLAYEPNSLLDPIQTITLRVEDSAGLVAWQPLLVRVPGPQGGPDVAFGDGGNPVELETCVPDFADYVVPAPSISDACTPADDLQVVALLTSVNGVGVPFPVVPVDAEGAHVSLPPGDHEITWRVTGVNGTTEVVQSIHVSLLLPQPGDLGDVAGPPGVCCAPGQTLVLGTSGPDERQGPPSGDHCVMTFGGDDDLAFGSGRDWLYAGSGDDLVVSGTGPDLLYGAGGDDVLLAASAFPLVGGTPAGGSEGEFANRLYGGFGADILQGGVRPDWLAGGRGNDVLVGSGGADGIYPGRGRDLVDAGPGDDEIYIYDECELAAQPEIILCGPGEDTVYAPVGPISFEFGWPPKMTVRYVPVGCEHLVITEQLAFRSECRYAAIGGPGGIEGKGGQNDGP